MGRGSSKIDGGSSGIYKGLRIEGSAGQYQRQADEVVKGAQDVLKDFGLEDTLKTVIFDTSATFTRNDKALASMNGLGELQISTKYLARGNRSSEGWHTAESFYGTGTHEAGHAVVNSLLKKVNINPDDKNKSTARASLEKATAREKGKLEKAVIKEAKRRYGSNPAISGYGSTNVKEKVAEAVSDVYSNGKKANSYSKEIVGVLKDIKKGKFKPTIKVSKREMGI